MKTNENINGRKSVCIKMFICLKLRICVCIACLLLLKPCFEIKASDSIMSPWPTLMAENLMNNPTIAGGNSLQDYVFATALKSLRELWEVTKDTVYFQYISEIVDNDLSFYEGLGSETYYDMDYINGSSLILFMYSQTGDSRYLPALDSTLKYINSMLRTSDGGIYHRGTPSVYRLQLDDLFMIAPFMAEYGDIFNKPEVYQDAVKQAKLFEKYMRDTVTGLMYHTWYDGAHAGLDGCTPYFWGRGVGWVAMALVDMLDFLPETYSGRDSIISVFQRLAEAVSEVQDNNSNVWWQVMDKGNDGVNYLESSSSCMFVYAIAKGIRLGYLNNSYLNYIEKGMQGIMDNYLERVDDNTINITNSCPGQGPSFAYNDYFKGASKNGHAVGPFIRANLETAKLNIYPVGIKENKYSNYVQISTYPNPFSNVTTISLTLPETEFITLDVYSILGQKVESLYKGIKPEGSYSFKFNPSEINSSVYICRLQAGHRVIVKNMILVKRF